LKNFGEGGGRAKVTWLIEWRLMPKAGGKLHGEEGYDYY